MRARVVSVVLALTVASSLAGQVDVTKLGPQIGDRVPDFSLIDQRGQTQTLRSMAGPKGTMLVFFRSADW
jgi:hypothetical protein